MKQKTIYLLLFFIMYIPSGYAQLEMNSMKKFDIETYKEYRTGNALSCKYKTVNAKGDSIEIELEDFGKKYLTYIFYVNTPLKKYIEYDKETLNMTLEIESFYDCPIGYRREYNGSGKLVKEVNADAPFAFSWQDLVEKMRKEYGIELLDMKEQRAKGQTGVKVVRDSRTLVYGVFLCGAFIPERNGWSKERFAINGTTGELIAHEGNDSRRRIDWANKIKERNWTPLIDE